MLLRPLFYDLSIAVNLLSANTPLSQYRISKKRIHMKKFMTTLLMAAALASSAFAHHMAAYEDAGIYIDEDSPHLDMVF